MFLHEHRGRPFGSPPCGISPAAASSPKDELCLIETKSLRTISLFMFDLIRKRFAAKLILLIGLVFIIPVATSLITITATSQASLDWFDGQLHKETVSEGGQVEVFTPDNLRHILTRYERGRTATLVITLMVVSFVLAGVVILLSLLILKR